MLQDRRYRDCCKLYRDTYRVTSIAMHRWIVPTLAAGYPSLSPWYLATILNFKLLPLVNNLAYFRIYLQQMNQNWHTFTFRWYRHDTLNFKMAVLNVRNPAYLGIHLWQKHDNWHTYTLWCIVSYEAWHNPTKKCSLAAVLLEAQLHCDQVAT